MERQYIAPSIAYRPGRIDSHVDIPPLDRESFQRLLDRVTPSIILSPEEIDRLWEEQS